MNKPGSTFCDAPTVPEMQQTRIDPELSDVLSVGYKLRAYKLNQVVGQSQMNLSYLAQTSAKGSGDSSYVILKEYFPCSLVKRNSAGEVEVLAANKRVQFETGKQHFLREACFLMAIDHSSIVDVDTVFSANGSVYMVMPYEEGESLFQKLNRVGKMNQEDLLELLFPITEGLELIHDQGCLHRDLKPSNIFIRESGLPMLLDFGSAIFKEQRNENCTPMISQGYTPIEQYSTNTSDQGFWTDIYALAAVLYKSIIGVPPVDAVERGQRILKDLEDPYQPLMTSASGDYSLRFLSAIDHGLCFRAEDRPQNIAEWCAEFDGTVPVWLAAESVRKDLLAQTARRAVDFDLYS